VNIVAFLIEEMQQDRAAETHERARARSVDGSDQAA
jgi:hypothetical protein